MLVRSIERFNTCQKRNDEFEAEKQSRLTKA